MKKIILAFPLIALFAACGEKEAEKEEVVVLEDFAPSNRFDRYGEALDPRR